MAEFANFPETVVALAREKAAELEDFSTTSTSDHEREQKVVWSVVTQLSCKDFMEFIMMLLAPYHINLLSKINACD